MADNGWTLLITRELLERFAAADEPLGVTGVLRPEERLAIALRAAAPGDQTIGYGWREPFEPAGPAAIMVVVPPVGDVQAWQEEAGYRSALTLQVYSDSHRFARLERVLDVPRMRKAAVTIAGCGAVGSEMARQLASAGVRRFYLADMDFLMPVNMPRHACDARDLFRRKADAVRDLVLHRNPEAQVDACHADLTGDGYDWLRRAASASDLLIAVTDSNRAQRLVHREAVRAAKPFLHAGLWERAFGGEVLWVLPRGSALAQRFGVTPCWDCVFGAARNRRAEPARKTEDAPCLTLDPQAGQPGAGVDLSFVTQVALGYALAMLDADSSRCALLERQPNLVYIHSGKRLEWPEELRGPFDVRPREWATFAPDCPVCGGTPAQELDAHIVL